MATRLVRSLNLSLRRDFLLLSSVERWSSSHFRMTIVPKNKRVMIWAAIVAGVYLERHCQSSAGSLDSSRNHRLSPWTRTIVE
jgi:hypothetical protein